VRNAFRFSRHELFQIPVIGNHPIAQLIPDSETDIRLGNQRDVCNPKVPLFVWHESWLGSTPYPGERFLHAAVWGNRSKAAVHGYSALE